MNHKRPTLEFALYLWNNYRKSLLFGISCLLIGALVDASAALMVAPIFDLIMNDQGVGSEYSQITKKIFLLFDTLGLPKTSVFALSFFLTLYICRSVITIITNIFAGKIRAALQKNMTLNLYKSVVNANWKFYLTRNQGQFINSITRETQALYLAYDSVNQLFVCFVQISVFTVVAFYISWQITLICLIVACLCATPLFLLTRLSYRWGHENVQSAGISNSITQESFSLAKVIQAYAKQGSSYQQLEKQQNIQEKLSVRFHVLAKVIQELFYPIGIISIIIAYYFSRQFDVPFAKLSIVLYALWKTAPFISNFLSSKSCLGQHLPSFFNILNLEKDALAHPILSGDITFEQLYEQIEFKNVSFSYQSAENKALNDINLNVKKGKMTALVGASGSGKSTLADMLMGFHQAQEGQILVDGCPLSDINLKSYRQKIGYVPQQSVLFNTTIRENLLWSKEDATEEDLRLACQSANALEFVEQLPNGFDTEVGDRGVRLSGGQIQRLAIARAIIRKPDLLILDEATSSLDSDSEQEIQKAINKIAESTTTIVIAHRLSTIKNADFVYILSNGKLIEEGTYAFLINDSGSNLSEMVKRQFTEDTV